MRRSTARICWHPCSTHWTPSSSRLRPAGRRSRVTREVCATLGTDVSVETATGRVDGRAIAIDDRGALVLETASGRVELTSGEIVRVRSGAPA